MPRGAGGASAAAPAPPPAADERAPAGDAAAAPSLLSINVPPFLFKTYSLVSDANTDAIVSWSADGCTFIVWSPGALERDVLPKYFTHSNFASFVRQLNNYGFRKASSSSGRHEFGAAGFRRGCPELLRTLRRLDTSRAPKKGAATAAAQAAAAQALAVAQAASRAPPGNARGSAAAASGGAPGGGEGEPLALQAGVLLDDVAALKRDRAALLREVRTLREGAAATQASVRELSARLASTEAAQAQMLRWGAAAAHNHHVSHHNINNSKPMLQGGAQPLSLPAADAKRGGRGAARQVSREGGALALAALSEAAAAAESRGARSIVAERLAEAEAAASAAASAAADAQAAAAQAEEAAQRKRARADELARGVLAARSELQEAQAQAAAEAGSVRHTDEAGLAADS